MIIIDLPEKLIAGQKLKLLAPDVSYCRGVYTLIFLIFLKCISNSFYG